MDRETRLRALELLLLAMPAAANVAADWLGGGKTLVVLGGVAGWLAYGAWRVRVDAEAPRAWGLRRDTLAAAALAASAFTLPLAVALAAHGAVHGRFPPPRGFWLIVLLYPVWGVAQQLLLNGMLARNLEAMLPRYTVAPLAGALFALAHAPDVPVMGLTLAAGIGSVWFFRRWPNAWALGVAHGILGAAVFYFVLGRDPAAELLAIASR